MGNLLPTLVALPFGAFGVWDLARTRDIFSIPGLLSLLACPIAGWLAVNAFGLWGNRSMQRAVFRRHYASASEDPQRYFVGIATPGYRSLWDPHEDVGYLELLPDMLRYRGDAKSLEIPKRAIREVVRKPNAHTWLGLGGWISIEGILEGRPIRLSIEPRERNTLLANRRVSAELLERLHAWRRQSETELGRP